MKCHLKGINNPDVRESNFELLRLISMFFIVLYHLLLWFVQDNPSHCCLKAFWLPLHIGVICFVLISGYFRIKPSSRGLIKLVMMVLVYSLPSIVIEVRNAGNWHDIVHSFMFISRTNYWFVRTYIGLYLFSPLINTFLDHSSIKGKWYLLIVTGFVSVYLGCFTRYHLYVDGKNLINFLFLYQLGQMLSFYSNQWVKIKLSKVIVSYVLLNVMIVVSYYYSMDTHIGELIWRFSYPYSSPVLIVNAVLFFIIVGHFSFKSPFVNRLSAGVFAIYLIHGSVPLLSDFQRNTISYIFPYAGNNLVFIGMLVLMSLVVMLCCLSINKLLSPIWKLVNSFGDFAYKKLGF